MPETDEVQAAALADGSGERRRVTLAGLLLGIGLGGFVDGIVFHQILQWHHMVTAVDRYPAGTVRGLEVNTLWDGLFHLVALVCTIAGIALLWPLPHRPRPEGRQELVGLMVLGWGAFNMVEGVVDHLVLRVHHVRDDVAEPWPWDLAFLAASGVLIVAGWVIVRRSRM